VELPGESSAFKIAVANYELHRCSTLTDLVGAEVESAEIGRDGLFTIEFSNGRQLISRPHPKYEAWQVEGPRGLFVVCPAGGDEPAIWDEAPAAT
jgi:hypothetical protein